MSFPMTLEDFLKEAESNLGEWQKTLLNWDELTAIAEHHEKSKNSLSLNAAAIANRLQGFEGVHSVRWRVKDTLGLLKKILRKNLEEDPKEKWTHINLNNYRKVFSDLIGIRGLHLLKDDSTKIDNQIRETWKILDTSIFLREGDTYPLELLEHGATVSNHIAGYRSIHYGFEYVAEIEPVFIEIQTRTLFQEGWSEIDHKIKYPNLSDNQLLDYCLNVFNGLSGTADDMGSFVIELDKITKKNADLLLEKESDLTERDLNIQKLQHEINNLKEEGLASKNTIESLQNSLDNLKKPSGDVEKSGQKSADTPRKIILQRKNTATSKHFHLGALAELSEIYASINRSAQLQNSPALEAAKLLKELANPFPELDRALRNITLPELDYINAIKKITSQNELITRTINSLTDVELGTPSKPTNESNAVSVKMPEEAVLELTLGAEKKSVSGDVSPTAKNDELVNTDDNNPQKPTKD